MYIYIYICKIPNGFVFWAWFQFSTNSRICEAPNSLLYLRLKSPDPSLMEPDFLSLRGGPNVSIKKHSY